MTKRNFHKENSESMKKTIAYIGRSDKLKAHDLIHLQEKISKIGSKKSALACPQTKTNKPVF